MRTRSPRDDPLLLWWAECVDMLDQLTPRNRARALSLVAEDLRQTLAAAPEGGDLARRPLPPWLVNRILGWEVFALPPRDWQVVEQADGVRIIG